MSSFYTNLYASVAKPLLQEFNQGVVEIGRPVTQPPANEWDPPVTDIEWTRVNAVARGVSQKYVDGENIVATDLQLTVDMGAYDPDAGDRIRIDGKQVSVLRFDRIPAAGVTVAWRCIVRG